MNIAVLFYGQPRFFDFTYKFHKEEFSIPGHNTYIFAHFWKNIGYIPQDDIDKTYVNNEDIIVDRLQKLNTASYKIEDYTDLDNTAKTMKEMSRFLKGKDYKSIEYSTRDRYHYGQHISLKKCYLLMEKFEKTGGLGPISPPTPPTSRGELETPNYKKFDVVIKCRTDFIHKNEVCYKDSNVYFSEKSINYTEDFLNFDTPFAKGVGVMSKRYDEKTDSWSTSGKYPNLFDPTDTDFIRDRNNILRIGDISLACNRSASRFFYRDWFNTYIDTLLDDVKLNNNVQRQIYRRHDALQGETALLYNIKLLCIPRCRFHRIIIKNKLKPKWDTHQTIYIDENYNDSVIDSVQEQLLNFNIKRPPG